MQKNIIYKRLFIAMVVLSTSCSKMIEIGPPPTQITAETVFQTESTANAAMAGIYRSLRDKLFQSNFPTLLPGLSGDEVSTLIVQPQLDPFRTNNIQSNDVLITGIWSAWYNIIFQANSLLAGLQNSPIGITTKNTLRGEALWVRGYAYYYLLNLFGDVPLVLTTDAQVSSKMPRESVANIYTQINKDLLDAMDLLPTVNAYANGEKIRVNKACAAALLARVYLYQGNWSAAEQLSNNLITSGTYQLLTDLTNITVKNNAEVIFQLANSVGDANVEPTSFFLIATPVAALSSELWNSFEPTDGRKANWLKPVIYLGKDYATPYKYRVTGSATTEYYTLFRLGEQLLIRAEARAWQNKLTGSNSAVSDLNILRQRAGLPALLLTDKSDILAAVKRERQRELFAEPTHRWFDLKRTGDIDSVMSAFKGTAWQSTDALYPIPLSELQKNPALKQNPGY